MAITKYSVTTSSNQLIDLASVLSTHYGAGVTIHMSSASNLIFSCPAISNRVIKLARIHSTWLTYCYYVGTGFEGSATIPNQKPFSGQTDYSSSNTNGGFEVIAGDSWLVITHPNNVYGVFVSIIGKLTNGEYMVYGGASSSSTSNSYSPVSTPIITGAVSDTSVRIVGFDSAFTTPDNKIYKMPLVASDSSDKALLNADGSLATFRNMCSVSYVHSLNAPQMSNGYILLPGNLYTHKAAYKMTSSIMIEL